MLSQKLVNYQEYSLHVAFIVCCLLFPLFFIAQPLPNNANLPAKKIRFAPEINPVSMESYDQFVKKYYPDAKSKTFIKMTSRAEGFGGVVFGSAIHIDNRLPVIKAVEWVPQTADRMRKTDRGSLNFSFEDGTKRSIHNLFKEDVYAAFRIIYTNIIAYQEGEGIGLVGMEGQISFPDSTSRWNIVIHPGIEQLELSRIALSVDALPIAYNELFVRTLTANMGQGEMIKNQIVQDFKTYIENQPDNWKIIDVPVDILPDGLFGLTVIPKEKTSEEAIYLSMQGFWANEHTTKEVTAFKRLMPVLIQSIEEINRLNTLAKTLALLRWAYKDKADFLNPPAPDLAFQLPLSVQVTADKRLKFPTAKEEQQSFQNCYVDFHQQLNSIAAKGSLELQQLNSYFSFQKSKQMANRHEIWTSNNQKAAPHNPTKSPDELPANPSNPLLTKYGDPANFNWYDQELSNCCNALLSYDSLLKTMHLQSLDNFTYTVAEKAATQKAVEESVVKFPQYAEWRNTYLSQIKILELEKEVLEKLVHQQKIPKTPESLLTPDWDALTEKGTPNVDEPLIETPEPLPFLIEGAIEEEIIPETPLLVYKKLIKKTSLRKAPDSQSKVLKRFDPGDEVIVMDNENDPHWTQVTFSGKTGWVKSALLR